MIFADASAVVAIVSGEPEAPELLRRLEDAAGQVRVSPLVRMEVVFALAKKVALQDGRRPVAAKHLEQAENLYANFLAEVRAEEVVLDADIGRRAVEAARTYGKLVRHPARLNVGDCFAYACARSLSAELLYKGDDFARTDLG